jgi:hypothetical protein
MPSKRHESIERAFASGRLLFHPRSQPFNGVEIEAARQALTKKNGG